MEGQGRAAIHPRVAAAALCTLAMLLPAGAAEAKEVLVKASACGASGCNVERSTAETQTLPFTLLAPTMEPGRATSAPPRGERFRIKLWTDTGRNRTTRIVSDYFPGPGYLRVEGRHGRCGYRCMPIRARWVELDSVEDRMGSEAEAYADLTEGLVPFPAAAPERAAGRGGASPLVPIAAAIGVVGLAGIWRLKGA